MKTEIIFGFLILIIGFTIPVFAESLISVETDSKSYTVGDIIIISGNVSTVINDTPVTMQIFKENSMIQIAQIIVAEDGSYSNSVLTSGVLWSKAGEYTIKVTYGAGNIAETLINFSPNQEISTADNFVVNVEGYGTFDIKYSILGGIIKNMSLDKEILALTVNIESINEGSISLEIPREIIDAKNQDDDEKFIVIIDGIQVPYQETISDSNSRLITINFETGDSYIEVIGTSVIPEFGSIAVMILAAAIMSTVLITRNKFNRHI